MVQFKNKSLSAAKRAKDLVSRLTVEEKISLLPTRQAAIPRLGVNEYWIGGEGAHGVVDRNGKVSTVFPQPFALSATWDTQLLREIGSVIGDEARIFFQQRDKKGGLTLWFPTIDMERDPRWGRTEEAYGEDPFLAGKLAAAMIQGTQGSDGYYIKTATAPKHFYANNTEENRATASSVINKRNKHEYYLKVFSYAFKEGKTVSMMTAYNEINGRPCILLDELQDTVKGKWGCDGFIVCDGGDFSQTVNSHKYFATHEESIAASLRAGMDCFTDSAELVTQSARNALDKNMISEADIDRAVTNILKIRIRLGEFDENHPYSQIPEDKMCGEEASALALKAAREAVVLLKNDNSFLPADKAKIKKALIVGDIARDLYAGWYEGCAAKKSTVLDAVKEELKGAQVDYEPLLDTVSFYDEKSKGYIAVNSEGEIRTDASFEERSLFLENNWGYGNYSYKNIETEKYLTVDRKESQANIKFPGKSEGTLKVTADNVYGWFTMELFYSTDENIFIHEGSATVWKKTYEKDGITPACELAKNADIVFAVFGNHPLINARECVDRTDIAFPKRWTGAVSRLTAENENTVLVITAGYPYAIREEAEKVKAVIYSGQGSQNLGKAMADCIFGNFAPAGRLSMTWYNSVTDLPDFNDYDIIGKRTYRYFTGKVLYPFGYGLTYSSFEYSGLKLSKKRYVNGEDKCIKVSFNVKNTGETESGEVAQVYFAMNNASVLRPIKQLAGFSRFVLAPKEEKAVEFDIALEELEFFDINSNREMIESGDYTVFVGSSSRDIRLSENFEVKAETVTKRDMSFVYAENFDSGKGVTLLEDKYFHTCVGLLGAKKENGEAENEAGAEKEIEAEAKTEAKTEAETVKSLYGEVNYLNCAFTGSETKLNIRFGEGSEGKIEVLAADTLIAEVSPKEGAGVCIDAAIPEGTQRIKIKMYGNCKIRDFSFE
ncbi:MAG: glycoside hydrolase family 3 C-terminal domain-containing protein [Clostridiales bacterium]|jgi:beta-glucosidase|nr:glycoside hydrolase family 3 C-terminal domain-containing protein [Clostridiales bacterium]